MNTPVSVPQPSPESQSWPSVFPDHERTEADERAEHRRALVQSLRDCADFLEQHPTVAIPLGPIALNAFVNTKEELAAHARVASWEKCFQDQYFYLKKSFGLVSLEINAQRELLCRRVVTGTRVEPEKVVDVVEWICDDPTVLR